ncbi:hypothetical protein AAFG07_33805 [Bradyrhizobium sp. B097]|uniref:hypothetical protein n=1 Tax=Bradyrhizobium sp. B097 TaxID=3140244 RepID=UPI00318409F1
MIAAGFHLGRSIGLQIWDEFWCCHLEESAMCYCFHLPDVVRTLGAPLTLPSTPYSYTVLDQDLATALQEFGHNRNIRVNVSTEVKGRIRGRLPELPPGEFLDRLINLYDLQWYHDGRVLYISDAHEAQSRLLILNPISFDAFKRHSMHSASQMSVIS